MCQSRPDARFLSHPGELVSSAPLKFGEQLLAAGLVRPEQLDSALARHRAEGGYLAELLIDEGVPEEPLLRFVAAAAGASWITEESLAEVIGKGQALERLPLRDAEKMCVLPLSWNAHERALELAVPNLSPEFLERARAIAKAASIRPRLALRRAIRAGIRKLYLNDPYAFAASAGHPGVRIEPTARESVVARLGTPALGLRRNVASSAPGAIPAGTQVMGKPTGPAVAPVEAPVGRKTGSPVEALAAASVFGPAAPLETNEVLPTGSRAPLSAAGPVTAIPTGTQLIWRKPLDIPGVASGAATAEDFPSEWELPVPASNAPAAPPPGRLTEPAPQPASESAPKPAPVTAPGNEAPPLAASTSGAPDAQTLLQLYATLEQQQREIHLLRVANQLHIDLARARDLPTLIDRVMAFAFDYVPADDGVFLLRDAPGRALRPHLSRTRDGGTAEVVVSQTLLNEVESTREAVLSTDAAYDQRFQQSQTVIASRLRSAMGVPILVQDQVRGVIALSNRGRGNMFSQGDLAVLSAIAAQTSVAIENIELSARLAEDLATRDRLSRFLSPELVELAASGAALQGTGELRRATILFADIRGFTALAESLSPEETLDLLNAHFETMVDVVFSYHGFLDKFLGDGVMALWGVTVDGSEHAEMAMRAALEMQDRVRQVNESRRRSGKVTYEIGIGIHTGDVVFGAVGASRRRELTAVGDAVNTASRLCAWAEAGQVVATESAVRAAQGAVPARLLPTMQLKGKTREVRVYELLGG